MTSTRATIFQLSLQRRLVRLLWTGGVANYFFSATPGDTLPWVGAFRQMPTVYSEFNKDLQQEEYLTIAEYGFKLYRPENMVTVISATAAVPT